MRTDPATEVIDEVEHIGTIVGHDVSITPEELVAHMRRVESLCNLLEKLFGALANNPMFQAMIPPDVLAELRKK